MNKKDEQEISGESKISGGKQRWCGNGHLGRSAERSKAATATDLAPLPETDTPSSLLK
jgi:hypothetical protein